MIDIVSTSKGILIPRMTEGARDSISSPAIGLMVYNTTTNKFNFYNGSVWGNLFSGNLSKIVDADGDTKVDVETTLDADYISARIAGSELMAIRNKRIEMFFPGGSIAIGEEAGASDDGTSNFNTTLGTSAGINLLSGEHNTNIGAGAGADNIAGSANTFIGYNA